MAKGVWIVAEQRDGAFRKISFELASTARKLADQLGEEVCAVLCGSGIEGIAGQLGKYGVDKVFVADSSRPRTLYDGCPCGGGGQGGQGE